MYQGSRNREVVMPAIGTHEIRKMNLMEERMEIVLNVLGIQKENYSEENGKSVKILSEQTGLNRHNVSLALKRLRGRGKAFIGAKAGPRRCIRLWFKTNGTPHYYMKGMK